MLQTDQLTFGIAAAVFGIAGGMRRLPAYFDNPALEYVRESKTSQPFLHTLI